MRNFFRVFFFFSVALLLIMSTDLFALQTGDDPLIPPDNWTDVLINLKGWFASFAGVAALTAFVAAFFNGLLKVTKSFVKQLMSWGVGIVLLVATDLFNFGYAAEFPIWLAIIHGFAIGLASNGLFDIPWCKALLENIEKWFHKPPTGPIITQ